MTGGYIRGFDGLRAISVLLVLFTHLGAYHWLPEDAFIRQRVWRLMSGDTGVNIFFTLSGFLITRLLLREHARTGTIALRRFYIRRFLRLTPPFVVFVLINLVLALAGVFDTWLPGILISFVYLYNFIPTTYYDSALGHTWSLAVEEQFYLFWPLVLRSLGRRGVNLVMLLLITASAVVFLLLPDLVLPISRTGIKLDDLFHGRRLFVPAVGAIMVGAAVAVHPLRSFGAWARTPVVFGLLFLAPLWVPVALLEMVPLIQAAGVGLLLVWIIEHQTSSVVAFLEWRPMAYIGRISYGIYLYHVIFMGMGPGAGLIPVFPWNVLAALAFAVLSYELMERRFLTLKDRFR